MDRDACRVVRPPAGSFLALIWGRHNNLYRAFAEKDRPGEKRRTYIDVVGFTSFDAAFQMPTVAEGFDEIRKVSFAFEGDEEDRRRYGMWLEIGVASTKELERRPA
jgi:bifunctional polynucleotide phosphatase/kinase